MTLDVSHSSLIQAKSTNHTASWKQDDPPTEVGQMQKDLGLGDNMVNGTLAHPCHHALYQGRSGVNFFHKQCLWKGKKYFPLNRGKNTAESYYFRNIPDFSELSQQAHCSKFRSDPQESYKSCRWGKKCFSEGKEGPISVTHDKNYPPLMETVVDTVKGRDSGKGAGSRPWSEKVQHRKVCGWNRGTGDSRKTMGLSSLDFQTQIIVDSFMNSKEYCK